ncbi:MAG: metallophosphoesterase [Cyanothece sp. SIO2G6]|nr:metallophosphoesterase [Cyanothece sp. SIO2G6]
MSIIIDAPIASKIDKMRQRVRWNHPKIFARTIDQTAFYLDDGPEQAGGENASFSFLVIGDSGSGPHTNSHPQRRIAEQMVPHLDDCQFLLHMGDVVYQVGSHEHYPQNFIEPYREWLVEGDRPKSIAYDQMVFQHPFLPVLGNHDYYNLPWPYRLLTRLIRPVKRALGSSLSSNLGTYGSNTGDTYARAFLDYLQPLDGATALESHLDQHYTAQSSHGRCLRYQPGIFTRLPNRYYTFRYGGIDFFALDSSTFNEPSPLAAALEDGQERRSLLSKRYAIEQDERQIYAEAARLDDNNPKDLERIDDLQAKLEQLDEIKRDIHKQLTANDPTNVDIEQLRWLQQRLIDSWHQPEVQGRVIYFHHPPYVTEATKWHQSQTLAVRHHIRWVLDGVAAVLGRCPIDRPIVDLILSGHAHCLEHLQTGETGHADAHLNWVICGGSGFSLRRQREEGATIEETRENGIRRAVARSKLYVGLKGHRGDRHRSYSFLRVDVQLGNPPKFVLQPYISERYHSQWQDYALEPFML